MIRTPRRCVLACALAITLPSHSHATPPFASELERLAEIMGSLQFLTELCAEEEQPWRAEMTALIAAAEGTEAWRMRVADRYNLGYTSFAAIYRDCTPAAIEAISRYRQRGAILAEEIAQQFGSPDAPVDPNG